MKTNKLADFQNWISVPLKHYYITKRFCELLSGNSKFLIQNCLNQLFYYMDVKVSYLFVAEIDETLLTKLVTKLTKGLMASQQVFHV